MRTTNAKSRQFVKNKEPFRANNLKGECLGSVYVVYSYNWYPLFVFSFITRKWYENEERYSVSTSRQRGQCHPQEDTILMKHEELKEFITDTCFGVTYEQMQNLGVADALSDNPLVDFSSTEAILCINSVSGDLSLCKPTTNCCFRNI